MNVKLTDAAAILRNRLVSPALFLADKAAGIPTLAAVRSALIVMLPFMFLGSLAILLNSFPLAAYKDFMVRCFGPRWTLFGETLYSGTFAIMSLSLVFSIGQHLVDQFNSGSRIFRANPVIAGLVNLAALFCLFPQSTSPEYLRWFGVAGLFVALLVGLASTRLFLFFFSFKQLHLHLRGGAPDIALPRTFNSFLPGILTLLVFAGVGALLHGAGSSVHELAHHYIRLPFDALHDGLERSLLYILSLHVLWFMGIHGANVLDPITHDIYGAAMLANEAAAAAGLPLPHIMTKNFMDVFVFMGGSGSSICLAGALILFGKTRTSRGLGILSLLPGVFNINEILLFGLPVVLNPLMLIPFVCTPLLLAGVSYLAASYGLVPGASVALEWTTPVLLNGYLTTGSLSGTLLQLLNLSLGICIYAPFVVLTNKVNIRRTNAAFATLAERIYAGDGAPYSRLQDDAGTLARSLIADLEEESREARGLSLEYQPQVDALTGRVVGVESLLRWRHPVYGAIPAPVGLTLAEESGLIRPMGLWIFETACRTRRRWLDAGLTDLSMAVNVSALQLQDSLPEQFMAMTRRWGLPPALMSLEVTESRALDSGSPESRVLTRLHDLGFSIAIDDFGMGHSSLKYLKQFPVNYVKIDGEITKELVTNPICRDIVTSITRLCRARGMLCVAEFVENDEQVAILREEGCDIFQGWRYSPSLPERECLAYIQANHALCDGGGFSAASGAARPTSVREP